MTLGAVAIASLAAVADGALLGGDPEPEPPQSLHLAARRREYAHRALALTRVLGHLVAGAGIAITLYIERGDGIIGGILALTTALLVTIVVEGIGRSYGFAS